MENKKKPFLKVGDSQVLGTKGNILYKQIPCDQFGWIDANVCLPADYELMHLKVHGKKNTVGWCVGRNWDGRVLESEDVVTHWKRNMEF